MIILKYRFLALFAAFLVFASSSHRAVADTVPVGFFSFDVVGTNLAEFDIANASGPGSFDPADFPITTTLDLSNLGLTVDYLDGTMLTFGPSYFTSTDGGYSFTGTPLLTTLGASNGGFANATSATLTGFFSTNSVTFTDGTSSPILNDFSATDVGSGPSGLLQDQDSGIIGATPTPEPGALILTGTGFIGLFLMRRRLLPGNRSAVIALGLVFVFLLASTSASSAQSVNLSAWAAPNSGASGVTSVTVTGGGYPSGTIPAGNVTVSLANACAGSGTLTPASTVAKVIGTTERVQFLLPASLGTGTYYVSLSGTTSVGTAFASINCAEVNVTGSSPTATLSASAVTFASLTAGTSSPTQTVTLSNTGTGTLNISGVAVTGAGANLFTESDNCLPSVSSGAYCTITTGFNPLIAGPYGAAITVTDNASPATQSVALSGVATPFAITIDTTIPTDWKISNGALNIDFDTTKPTIWSVVPVGTQDQLMDFTPGSPLAMASPLGSTPVPAGWNGPTGTGFPPTDEPDAFYMINSGLGSGNPSAHYLLTATYLDWWIDYEDASKFSYSKHYVVTPNDTGIHIYFPVNQTTASTTAGSIAQIQWIFRANPLLFTSMYAYNADLSMATPVITPVPSFNDCNSSDLGRNDQDATGHDTIDLLPQVGVVNAFSPYPLGQIPQGFHRKLCVKYDFSSYEYLHQAQGMIGSEYGIWAVFTAAHDSFVGGPSKQNLNFTTSNLVTIEPYSGHYNSYIGLTVPAGTAYSRLFGPYYVRFNKFGGNIQTPQDMYNDAVAAGSSFANLYNNETQLLASGYVPSTARGTVSVQVSGVIGSPKTAWAVLSDPAQNHQLSQLGYQYWADISSTGSATLTGVLPGTYRLSVYDFGQFGEYRNDSVVVAANQTAIAPYVTFVPENFGTTVWTIGTPDRSAHEFLHGSYTQNFSDGPLGYDDREYYGAWNYWADFAANKGAVIYNATAGPAGAATNDLTQWNYQHFSTFDPGLYGGAYVASDDTTDGYKYIIPSYVNTLSGHSGTNGVSTKVPAWTVNFATPSNVTSFSSGYAVLSVALATAEGTYTVSLNGHSLGWSPGNANDAGVRSGLSAYTQWAAYQWPVSDLAAAGANNVLSISVSANGAMDDALRLELSNTGAAPSVTGWHDYTYVTSGTTTAANDVLPNP